MVRVMFMIIFFLVLAGGLLLFENREKLPLDKATALSQSATPVLGTITESATTVVQTTSQNLTQSLSKLPQSATPGGEKIQVNDAVRQVQAQIEKLPGSIAERARYDYCRQVIADYEREHPVQ